MGIQDWLQRAFRVGAIPRRMSAIKQDARRHYGGEREPDRSQIVAYVLHHYTNYERICRYIRCSQVDHYEFRKWASARVEQALADRGIAQWNLQQPTR